MAETNKQRITEHNARLQTLSAGLDVLPDYEDIDPEVTEQEDIIAQIKAVLPFKGASTGGQYVWKKYESALPDGYTEVEYLESTGTQYIDTGLYGTQDTAIEIEALLVAAGSSDSCQLFGDVTTDTSGISINPNLSGSGSVTIRFGSNTTSNSFTITLGTKHTFKINNVGTYLDGTKKATWSNVTDFITTSTMALFRTKGSSSVASWRVYSCRIYDNDVLVRDFIPCTNSDRTAGMYDLVNGVFYANAGSGIFTVSEEAVYSVFNSFVVSDDESAYPDKAEQDGYYYELVEDGLTPETLGFTKVAVDKILLSSDLSVSNGNPLNHSLGDIPRLAIVTRPDVPTTTWTVYRACIVYDPNTNKGYTSAVGTNGTVANPTLEPQPYSSLVTVTDSYAGFNISGCLFKAGVEYTLITMA